MSGRGAPGVGVGEPEEPATQPTMAGSGWDRLLSGVIAVVALYALGLVLAGLALGDSVFDALGFGPDDGQIVTDGQRDYLRLVYGILGAVIVGWMVVIGAIVRGPLRRRERWAWQAVMAGVTVWFALDTALSLVMGFQGHALFNVGFAVALSVPLVAIGREIQAV